MGETALNPPVSRSGLEPTVNGTFPSDGETRPSDRVETSGGTAVEAVLVARSVVASTIDGSAEAIDGFASALPELP